MTICEGLTFTNKQRALIMMPMLIGGFIALIDETILNVAFAQLSSDLNVPLSTLQWLATAYMMTIGILVPVVAFLLKTFSTKTMYLSALLLYTIGTICCGFSQSFTVLLVSRIVEAAGAGMMMPIMMNTIMQIYPPAKRGAALGIVMMVIVLAPGIGPTVSGIVLQFLDWHWLFFLTLPFAFFAMIMGAVNIKNVSTLTKPKIDVLSIILSTIGFGGLIFGICSIENYGFMNSTVVLSVMCGIAGLILFSKRQFSLQQPLLELRSFRYPMFSLGVVLMFIAFMIPFAVGIILPTYFQNVLGLSPFVAGLALLPGCVADAISAPLVGHIYDRKGVKLMLITGFATLSVAMFFLSGISASTSLIMLIAIHICLFLGISVIFTPLQANSLNQLPRENTADGVAILNTAQQIAAAFGSSLFVGLMGVVETQNLEGITNPSILQQQAAIISGVGTAFTAALIIVIIGLGLSFFIKQKNDS